MDVDEALKRWTALEAEDREAIIQVIAEHEAQATLRQIQYAKTHHDNLDKVLMDAFKRRRIAAVLAQRILGGGRDASA